MPSVVQNKFLETVLEVSRELDATFFLASASIPHHPIIYCSQGFSEESGFTRHEVCQKDVFLEFLSGRQTSEKAIEEYDDIIRQKKDGSVEMILYDKQGKKAWYVVNIQLVKDTDGTIVLFLVLFNDITHLKAKIHETPIRLWKRATRKILKKTDLNFRFDFSRKKGEEEKDKSKKRKKMDLETISQKVSNVFIPIYGAETIQVPKFVILHTKTWKSAWDIWVLFCILYTCCVVPFVICFDYTDTVMTVFDTFVDINFMVDVVLTLFTTYLDAKGEIVSNLKLIRNNYLKTWFLIDFIAALPYSLFLYIPGVDQGVIEILRMLKIVRLTRLGKVKSKMERYAQMKTFVLGVWILFFSLIGHWMACIWYIIALKFDDPFVTKHGWINVLAELSNEPYKFDADGKIIQGSGPTVASLYISALYYTLSSLTTCGFGNIAPNSSAEKFFGCVTMLMGCVLYAFIFGQVTNIISQMQKNSNEYSEQLASIKQFNEIYKVPTGVASRLESYYKATFAVTKGTDEEEILQICPRDLQSDLCLHIHSKIFESNNAFARVSNSALRILSRYLSTIRTSPGDKLIYQGENVDTIYFIASGALEVKNGKKLVGLIGPGDAFGKRLATELKQEGRSLYDVEACSFGAVHCIKCEYVQEALEMYAEEYYQLRQDLVLSFDITRQIKVMTKDGSLITSEIPDAIKEVEQQENVKETTNVYSVGDEMTTIDTTHNIDVLAGMSELKGELRRETERMNSKMGIVETQIRLILKLLRRQNKVDVDPEIGNQLNELMSYGQDMDDENGEWFVADSKGWKEAPPTSRKTTVVDVTGNPFDDQDLTDADDIPLVEMKTPVTKRKSSGIRRQKSASSSSIGTKEKLSRQKSHDEVIELQNKKRKESVVSAFASNDVNTRTRSEPKQKPITEQENDNAGFVPEDLEVITL